ncbi:MAG TPA: alpha/beta hydrolase [Acidobacteriaceae bacterium]
MPRKPTAPQPQRPATALQVVDHHWLLKMLATLLGASMVCAYITLCLLFYQGQWQFALHPLVAATAATPTTQLPYQDVRFDYTETGAPQLHGWWIPALSTHSRYANVTVLYLHGGEGPFAAALPRLQQLHDLGLNIFAFDYRGFGLSAGPHPSEQRMREDAEAAWTYLAQANKSPATEVIVYGEGVGAALALELLAEHPRVPVALFEDPVFDLIAQVRRDPRAALVPVGLLFHQRFEIAAPLRSLTVPKLLFLNDSAHAPTAQQLASIAGPKFLVHLGSLSPQAADAARSQSLSRFLDEYLPAHTLLPQ